MHLLEAANVHTRKRLGSNRSNVQRVALVYIGLEG